MNRKHHLVWIGSAAMAFSASTELAAGSPWLPPPGGGSLSVSYVTQSATEFYRSTAKRPTPGGGADLAQETLWVEGTYGLADAWALDFRFGQASSSFVTGPGLPPSQANISGLADLNLGVVWRVVDEIVRPSAPSIALRAAAIKAGDYDTGYINSLGDGGDGLEISAIVGKFVTDRFALSGEVGHRSRNSSDHDIPNSIFARFLAGVIVGDRFSLSLSYEIDDSRSGIEIGGPGFSPSRFPELQEDSHLAGATVGVTVSDRVSVGASFGKVVDGRNTAASDVGSISVSLSF